MSDNPTVPAGRSRFLQAIQLALLAGLLFLQLVVPPIVGLADNGDFSRVAGPLGIFPPEDLGDAAFFSWVVPRYRFEPERIWIRGLCCYSSQTLFAVGALPVGLAISPPGRFDLRATGIVNGLGFLAAMGLLFVALRPLRPALSILGGLLLVFMFSDVTYVSLFNSFYTEPAALIFLFAVVAFALLLARTPNPPAWLAAGYFLFAALLATSRPQNALLGFFFALLGVRLARYEGRRRRRAVVLAALAVCVVSFVYSRSTPRLLQRIYLFNAVFRELLPNSPDPRRDLAELGLPREFSRLIGIWGFGPEAPVADDGFQRVFGHVRYGTLAAFYAARPARLWSALERGAGQAFEMRPFRLGNYARETGEPPGSQNWNFSAWSQTKVRLAPGRLGFVIAYFLVSLIVCLHLRLKGRTPAVRAAGEIWIALVLVATFQFAVASVMTGAESRRSFFLFNAAFDLTVVALCLRGLSALLGLSGSAQASERAPEALSTG